MQERIEQSMLAEPNSPLRGTVENKAAKPAGLLPRNTQQLVILGVAVVMVFIMWLTSSAKRPPKTTANSTGSGSVHPLDPAAVQDFKQTIQKEQAATRQPISPSDLARLQALGLAGDVAPGSQLVPAEAGVPAAGGVIGGAAQEQSPPPDPVQEDKKKRQYLSLFAPNVAFTSRKDPESEQLIGQRATGSGSGHPNLPSPAANDLDGQLRNAQAQFEQANHLVAQASPSNQTVAEPSPQPKQGPGAFESFAGKRFVVFEGTLIETLLINRLNGTFSGPLNCLVTNDVYSHDRQHILIPAGTKLLGETKKVEALGQQRLAVFFHRMIMPDGFSVSLDEFKGLNQIGETALRDKVNNHYLQIFGVSLAVGILGGIAEAGTGNAFTNSPLDQARAGFGANLANSSMQILDRFLNILPTVTIREGNRVKVYLSGDLLLPDYTQHAMQPDL
ncbi:MAG: TrbI/VirB10 family protein [Candidatus Acidiferrum sp.]|jgi:type IV secretory pathway VirB10-like protein